MFSPVEGDTTVRQMLYSLYNSQREYFSGVVERHAIGGKT